MVFELSTAGKEVKDGPAIELPLQVLHTKLFERSKPQNRTAATQIRL